jgi:DNA repair exonuclease SbcCD ATPase subunit
MGDTQVTEDAPEEPQEAPKGDDEPFDADRAKAKIAKANSEAKALRDRLKEAEAKAAKLDEIEQAGKSEADKLRDQLTKLEVKAQEADQRATRAEFAASKGLTADQVKALAGSSLEELEASYELIGASLSPREGTRPSPLSKPQELLRGGGDPDEDIDPDIRQVVDSIPRGF